ncbi:MULTISPECIES: phosphotransacetylase [Glutamicibacter]|uniref:Recombinase n=1 Tax=Glutamicibacter creatinolyticus TaxID=162496 RepID=A0A5B7WS35_9MICC|nr:MULTISPECIES: phosphotransacetylase [Glutamicibacter]QCY46074.1 Recombinase [Glutamicibacter creatinolyticus]
MASTIVDLAGIDQMLLQRFEQALAYRNMHRIILPEGQDERIQRAADILSGLGAQPVLLQAPAAAVGNCSIRELRTSSVEEHLRSSLEPRGAEAVDQALQDPVALAMAKVACGEGEAVVAGATLPTADIMRSAFRVVGPAEKGATVSSCFLMRLTSGQYLAYGDCAVVPDPEVEQLARIAIDTAGTFQAITGTTPRVAMLSFSTAGSAEHPSIRTVREATKLVRQWRPSLCVDGELQFDAAADSAVAAAKAPQSEVAGRANVFIFPNLAAGNIGYKITQRLAEAQAYGPILQGLAAPVNDLSRGASVSDIVNVSLISLVQSLPSPPAEA